jgi:hypothetical protein
LYGGSLENIQYLYLYVRVSYRGSFLGKYAGGCEYDYNHTLIDDSSAQGGDKENYSVWEDNSNMCKNVVREMELMKKMAYMKIWELQSKLWHALDVLMDEHEMLKPPLNVM